MTSWCRSATAGDAGFARLHRTSVHAAALTWTGRSSTRRWTGAGGRGSAANRHGGHPRVRRVGRAARQGRSGSSPESWTRARARVCPAPARPCRGCGRCALRGEADLHAIIGQNRLPKPLYNPGLFVGDGSWPGRTHGGRTRASLSRWTRKRGTYRRPTRSERWSATDRMTAQGIRVLHFRRAACERPNQRSPGDQGDAGAIHRPAGAHRNAAAAGLSASSPGSRYSPRRRPS